MSSLFVSYIIEEHHQSFNRVIGVFDSFDWAIEGSIKSIEALIDHDIKNDSEGDSSKPVNDYAVISDKLKLQKYANFSMPGYDCEVNIEEFMINRPIPDIISMSA
jgi:hypothetical protein